MVTKAYVGSDGVYFSTTPDYEDCLKIPRNRIVGRYINAQLFEHMTDEEAVLIAEHHLKEEINHG
jgi:hypothetical protein